jgi:Thiamine pyrophosphate enzyme, C-terminal TPP binding domain
VAAWLTGRRGCPVEHERPDHGRDDDGERDGLVEPQRGTDHGCSHRNPAAGAAVGDLGRGVLVAGDGGHPHGPLTPHHGVFLENPDFAAYARLLGAHGTRVTDDGELNSAIAEALAQPGPSVVDVVQERMEGLPPGLTPPTAR